MIRLKAILRRIKSKAKVIVSTLAVYISTAGLVTFSLFILEESIQTAMFGTWPAQEAKDWAVVQFGCDRIRDANRALKLMNYTLGWIQPLAFLAYKSYGESTDIYIQGLEAKIFANAPELFAGRAVTFSFNPQSVTTSSEGFHHVNRRIHVVSPTKLQPGIQHRVTGRVTVAGNQLIIHVLDVGSTSSSNSSPTESSLENGPANQSASSLIRTN
ncbi:hypothetical protein [Desulfoferrobacter suflitae]|uniref:hypothetical protein n=1 Tax=Desulfoferrobacter suflitae TaxID=2865782 RepID=UPI0021647775|nr:hypothetical protein [Desulfoferrobacter suflitae]MCK8600087.1 hypothetical protein [Desulfoferrobacter suflitae]